MNDIVNVILMLKINHTVNVILIIYWGWNIVRCWRYDDEFTYKRFKNKNKSFSQWIPIYDVIA